MVAFDDMYQPDEDYDVGSLPSEGSDLSGALSSDDESRSSEEEGDEEDGSDFDGVSFLLSDCVHFVAALYMVFVHTAIEYTVLPSYALKSCPFSQILNFTD